jgi:hypothetical protein
MPLNMEKTLQLIAGMNRNLLLHTPTTPQAKDRSISKLEHNVLNLESSWINSFLMVRAQNVKK